MKRYNVDLKKRLSSCYKRKGFGTPKHKTNIELYGIWGCSQKYGGKHSCVVMGSTEKQVMPVQIMMSLLCVYVFEVQCNQAS